MYARSKVAARLESVSREYHLDLTYRTVGEVEAFEHYLTERGKYTFDELGKPSGVQSLTKFDTDWMQNERLLCACDAEYWLTRYCYLIDEEGKVLRFKFRTAQRILFDIISDLESRDLAIEIMVLKARQLGITSLIQPLIGHRIFFGYGVNAIAGSADQQKTGIMATKMLLAYDMCPIWLLPRPTRRVESDRGMLVFGSTLSGVSFQHGAQMSGIARGTTPTVYHLSEVASFADASSQIESSLLKCVHSSPRVFGVLESTGEGDKGWWPDTWRDSKAHWPLTRFAPLFLPWFVGTDLYPNATWLRKSPLPPDWIPRPDTREHIAKCELYVQSNPILAAHLGPNFRLPREQQWWWEVEHEQAKNRGTESVFLQELAGDDEEALQRSAESVFGHETISMIGFHRKRDYSIYSIAGQSIEADHEPPSSDIDYSVERIPVRWPSSTGVTYCWEFIPLLFGHDANHPALDEESPTDPIGKFLVWHPPRPSTMYSIGVDTAAGRGEDSTVISVWTYGSRGEPDVQCAEFASPYVNHAEAFSFVLSIAAWYAQPMRESNLRWREPYVTVEQVASVGDPCQLQMARMGYSNFHRMSRYDSTPRRIRRQKSSIAGKRGWFTYSWARPILLSHFTQFITNSWSIVNSPWLVNEMRQFEVHITATGKERPEHAEEAHDDRIFAAAMAVFCPHDLDLVAERSKKRRVEQAELRPPIDLTPYAGSWSVPSSALRERNVATLEDIVYSSDLERYR